MIYLVASDIHGSSEDCRLLLEAFAREGADRLLLLGDLLYHGPRNDLPPSYAPKKVIAMLNPLRDRILCVRGNCDAEVDQMVLDFPILDEHRNLELFGRRFLMTHGHHVNPEHLPGPDLAPGVEFLLFGHTHIPANVSVGGIRCLNPGSVSIPKAESWKGYLLIRSDGLWWKELDGKVRDRLSWEEA